MESLNTVHREQWKYCLPTFFSSLLLTSSFPIPFLTFNPNFPLFFFSFSLKKSQTKIGGGFNATQCCQLIAYGLGRVGSFPCLSAQGLRSHYFLSMLTILPPSTPYIPLSSLLTLPLCMFSNSLVVYLCNLFVGFGYLFYDLNCLCNWCCLFFVLKRPWCCLLRLLRY